MQPSMDDIVTPAAELSLEESGPDSIGTSGTDHTEHSIWDGILGEYDGDCAHETEKIGSLMRRLTGQLLHGCGHSDCESRYCATGLRNTTKVPTRHYTPRSARILAFNLLGQPNAESTNVCKHYQATVSPSPEPEEGPRDPSSFVQRVADTPSMRRLAKGESTNVDSDSLLLRKVAAITRKLQMQCQPPLDKDGSTNPKFASNEDLADTVGAALALFFNLLPKGSDNAVWISLATYINSGQALPSGTLDPKADHSDLVELLSVFSFEPYIRLCAQICKTISIRAQVEDIASKFREHDPPQSRTVDIVTEVGLRMTRIARTQTPAISKHSWVPWPYPLLLKRAFLENWDGKPVVKRGSTACGALELMELQQSMWDKGHPERRSDANLLPFIFKRSDSSEMMRSWMKHDGAVNTATRHLLSFHFLFTEGQSIMYFRTLNLVCMKEAHKVSNVNEELYDRYIAPSDAGSLEWDNHVHETQHLRDFYLLLTVRRERILEDAFDQLWQRRKRELLRPLRVRLGEMEGAEVGQDLGGVQIEFFNLVCKTLFSEDAGMFTTDSITGVSYFRPGSLQPLYMFELFGLLVALAAYNGITIPVSFPIALYRQLLAETCTQIQDVQDGWPEIARSLQKIEEGAYEGLEYAFPLEANGLRMSIDRNMLNHVRDQSQGYTKGEHAVLDLQVDEVSVMDTPATPSTSNTLQSSTHHWPGWRISNSHAPTTPSNLEDDNPPTAESLRFSDTTELSASTVPSYITDYTAWLTTLSVVPQLTNFRKGFHSLLPHHHIALFTPQTLKRALEGTTILDLASLRRATQYKDYDANEPYIQSFWSILERWPAEKQKALLKFVTAAERIPITGAGMLTFRIQEAEGRGYEVDVDGVKWEEQLPTSSTCFGTLYLPRYVDEEMLEWKLNVALEFGGVGFGTA